MKTATLFFTLLLFASSQSSEACCRFYETLRIKVMNETSPIYNAEVKLRSKESPRSYNLSHAYNVLVDKDNWTREFDSAAFSFYNRRYKGQVDLSGLELEISAPGYATVIIDGAAIKVTEYKEEKYTTYKLAILEVVLYAKQGMKFNNEYVVFDQFNVKDLSFTDSTRLDWTFYKSEIKDQDWKYTSGVQEETKVSARAYPNPAKDNLHIQLSYFPLAAHRIELHDANGKLVDKKEFQMEGYDLTMGWYAPGNYFLTIYDQSNTAILRQQIVHQ